MKSFKLIMLFVGFWLSVQYVLATTQIPEHLIMDGVTNKLYTLPLSSYSKNPIPIDGFAKGSPTSCMRGYIGTWQIKDGYLWLLSVQDFDGRDIPINKIFRAGKSPIKAKWYTGTLRIPQGKQLKFVYSDFDSQFEKDLMIDIQKGKVIKQTIIDNTKTENLPNQVAGSD